MEIRKHIFMIVPLAVLSLLVLPIPFFIYYYLRYKYDKIVVADNCVNIKTGVIFIQNDTLRKDKINNITINQGIFGRLFGYGTVIIQTAAEYGGIAYPYIRIDDCNKFREIFSN